MCSGGDVTVVVRAARAGDRAAREQLVRQALGSHVLDAFIMFFFHEFTLQCCVLSAAVLFIFCGVSVMGCALVVPTAAVVIILSVLGTHYALADKHVQAMRAELFGFVAEAHAPLGRAAPRALRLCAEFESPSDKPLHRQIVGTASVSAWLGASEASDAPGWLHALAVHPQWRRRGAARALCGAARGAAAARGLRSLEAAASALQPAAARLLHALGWECRGSYHRPLWGGALALPLLRLGVDLPAA